MTPDQYCQEKAARSGSSFYYSFLFLPPQRRLAITALYAFCREVDDVVDNVSDESVAHAKLAWWRTEIQRLYSGAAEHPVARALEPHLDACGITQDKLQAIIDGMEMDLHQNRYLDYTGLKTYCWHVAGVVGELSAGIFGHTSDDTLEYARELGLALQLTNIIRDVGDDARRGRIYLPINELQQFGVKAADILKSRYSDNFTALMRFQTQRARDTYRRALQLLPAADRRNQRPGLIMAAIYYALLEEIERADYQVLHQHIGLTPVRKLWIAWKTWVRGGRVRLPDPS